MRWTNTYRHNVRSIVDKFNIYNQVIERNHLKMRGTGTPCTYYKNTAFDDLGNFNVNATKCYCYTTQTGGTMAAPDPRHSLCQGTGVLSGYQRYGYSEHVYASTSLSAGHLVKTAEIGEFLDNGVSKGFQLNAGALQGDITTAAIPLTRFQAFDRFLAKDFVDKDNNRVEYYYSLDNINWTLITLAPYAVNDMANVMGTNIVIPAASAQIWFRARLKKRIATAPSPRLNHFRFRFRNMSTLGSVDARFPLSSPSFLAAREQERSIIEQGQFGWETKFPLKWWTLPEVDINNHDVIQFHQGLYANKKFLVDNVIRYTHGPELQVTHTSFETVIIRDTTDLKGVLYYLT